MTSRGVFPLLAITAFLMAAAPAPAPSPASAPALESTAAGPSLERWLWNARERTRAGLDALTEGDRSRAVVALETAAHLAPDDPLVRYNAGAGQLAGLSSEPRDREATRAAARDAVPHLEAAAAAAIAPDAPQGARDLAPDALYDLGTAHLAAGDPEPAVAALSETLRRAPQRADAKHNLELALRALDEQRQQQRQRQEQPRQPGDKSQEDQQETSEADQKPDRGQDRSTEPQSSAPAGTEPTPAGEKERSEGPLPDFVDQPNLSAREAAALLEAVENRERQGRRQAAAARARQRSREEKDW